MLTFAQAREVVWRELGPTWSLGNFTVLREGYEDEHDWLVIAGARESLVDDDPDYDLMDAPALLVDKRTGALERAVVIDNLQRLAAMTPVVSTERRT